MTVEQSVIKIKQLIENAITHGGTAEKNNLIRTSIPIGQIHELVKTSLIENKVQPTLIKPSLGASKGELELFGFIKKKCQDVCVISPSVKTQKEEILMGKMDQYGFNFTERTLSINVRSQLSSAAKNFDTLYERTFAESLNLHMRCNKMVLGEVYMIAVREYDIVQADNGNVRFKPLDNNIRTHVEKYLHYFSQLNSRKLTTTDHHKYEKICLLLVDFSKDVPKVYNTDEELKKDNLLSIHSKASIKDLSFTSFTKEILDIYSERFGKEIFTGQEILTLN
jgi:hypothetical protein